jgi:hypothetical protein
LKGKFSEKRAFGELKAAIEHEISLISQEELKFF